MSEDQAKESVNDAFNELVEEAISGVFESLKELESQINDKFGDPDILGQVWAVISTADRDETDQFGEDKVEAVLTGQGDDLYAGLVNERLAIAHSLVKGKIGTMIRTGAWMSLDKEIRPSEDPQRKSVIITVAYLANHIFVLVRSEDGNLDTSVLNEAGYNEGGAGGHQRLVDAVLDFDYLPIALKEHEPEKYTEILTSIISNLEGDEAQ
jgi:hypothetical protein